MVIPNKTVQCPHCKVILNIKNSKNEEKKTCVCPSCKNTFWVRFTPLEALTYLPRKKVDNGVTQLGPQASESSRAVLQFEGKHYLLKEGQNIVGRKASSSNATVQIDTTDRYMSRHHCIITVTTLSDGTKKAVINNYQNLNKTIVSELSLEMDDTIRLTDGNCIMMGCTNVTFKFMNEEN